MNFYYVYVLRSQKDKKLYIGSTSNLIQRFKEHNSGKSKSTRPRRPFNLIFYEAHRAKSDVERRERYFKTNEGKITLKKMLRSYFKME